MTKEALKLALVALEEINQLSIGENAVCLPAEIDTAMDAIKEALAQPEHGWTSERIAGMARLKEAQDKKLAQPEQKPMHPQLKAMLEEYFDKCFAESAPQRKPLTDEEIALIDWESLVTKKDLVKAIEAIRARGQA